MNAPPDHRRGETLRIVGAGPSGLAAGIHAARAGSKVVVYERASGVGGRFRDDFQGLENWTSGVDVLEELKAVGIAPTFEHVGVREQVCFDSDGQAFVFRSDRPFYYLVRRGAEPGTLDCALRDQALAAGVDIRFGEAVEHLPEGGVIARGPRRGDVIAVGYVFDTSTADASYGVLDDRLAPKGYGYLLLHKGRGTVATCMFADFHDERMYLERTVNFFREKVGMKMGNPRRFGGMGSFRLMRRAGDGRLSFAGEAAGLQDALWGFGMRFAMRSGVLSARLHLSLGDRSGVELDEKRLWDLYLASHVNRLIFSRIGNRGYSLFLRLMARATDPRAWLGKRYAHSFWKGLLARVVRASPDSRGAVACEQQGCDCTWCRCHRGQKRGA